MNKDTMAPNATLADPPTNGNAAYMHGLDSPQQRRSFLIRPSSYRSLASNTSENGSKDFVFSSATGHDYDLDGSQAVREAQLLSNGSSNTNMSINGSSGRSVSSNGDVSTGGDVSVVGGVFRRTLRRQPNRAKDEFLVKKKLVYKHRDSLVLMRSPKVQPENNNNNINNINNDDGCDDTTTNEQQQQLRSRRPKEEPLQQLFNQEDERTASVSEPTIKRGLFQRARSIDKLVKRGLVYHHQDSLVLMRSRPEDNGVGSEQEQECGSSRGRGRERERGDFEMPPSA